MQLVYLRKLFDKSVQFYSQRIQTFLALTQFQGHKHTKTHKLLQYLSTKSVMVKAIVQCGSTIYRIVRAANLCKPFRFFVHVINVQMIKAVFTSTKAQCNSYLPAQNCYYKKICLTRRHVKEGDSLKLSIQHQTVCLSVKEAKASHPWHDNIKSEASEPIRQRVD